MVILSMCGEKYARPETDPAKMTALDRLWHQTIQLLRDLLWHGRPPAAPARP